MGDPKKSRRRWQGPRHPWKKENLTSELNLVGSYGLRNKRELWLANSILRSYRNQAGAILALPDEARAVKEKEIVKKLSNLGLLAEDAILDSILDLSVEDIVGRRLQSVVFKNGMARTPHQARQLIVHGHICIGGRRVTAPGYLVSRSEESSMTCALPVAAAPESASTSTSTSAPASSTSTSAPKGA